MKCLLFFSKVLRYLFSCLLGGETCVKCGCLTFNPPLCDSCKNQFLLPWVPSINESDGKRLRCKCCGKELISEIDLCSRCKEEKLLLHTDYVIPVHTYRLWKIDLLYMWKYQHRRQLTQVFSELSSNVIKNEFYNTEIIPLVPVPPRPGKIRKQGWDQVEDLCKFLEKNYNFKVLRILERTTIKQQKKLNRKERLENLGQAYRVKKDYISKNKLPQKVILIDDVITTGVTMETCAKCLKEVGISFVYGFSLFSV